jgi:hypothetical protein
MSLNENGERRRSERFRTINLISYRDADDNGKTISAGMAQTVDLSENGALIKLQKPLNNPHIAAFELALEDEIVPLSGKVIEQFQSPDGLWCVRVDFSDLKPAVRHKLLTYIMNLV